MKAWIKKIISFILIVSVILGAAPAPQQIRAASTEMEFLAPIGTHDIGSTLIYTVEDFYNIRKNMYGSYVLANDIDLSSYTSWEPIGKTLSAPFYGKLDGQGHKITGLNVSIGISAANLKAPYHTAGLFGVCEGAVIRNLYIENADITIENSSGYEYASAIHGKNVYAGIIAGYATAGTVIYNCLLSGKVHAKTIQEAIGGAYAGAVFGAAEQGIVSYVVCQADVHAESANQMGKADAYAGGLAGYYGGESYIDHSTSLGAIRAVTTDYGIAHAGGFLGASYGVSGKHPNISDSYYGGSGVYAKTGNLFGDDSYAGGIAALFTGTAERVYVSGTVTSETSSFMGDGKAYAGGICATTAETAVITASATVQKNIIGRNAAYRIAGGTAAKRNNAAVNGGNSIQDADFVESEAGLKSLHIYQNILGWDFDATWKIQEGSDYPQLRTVSIEDTAYQEQFIAQHLAFISCGEYQQFLDNSRWAKTYWSMENNFYSNLGEVLYNVIDGTVENWDKVISGKFKALFESTNPYTVLITDYVSDAGVKEKVVEMTEKEVPLATDKIYKKLKKFVKENWKDAWGELSDEDIFYLYHYDEKPGEEWINENFQEHLSEIIDKTKHSGDGFEKVLGVSTDALDKIFSGIEDENKKIRAYNNALKNAAQVEAYMRTQDAFKNFLKKTLDHLPGNLDTQTKMREAILSYTQYSDEENERDHMMIQMGIKFKDMITDVIWDIIDLHISNFVSQTFSEAALAKLKAAGWFAEKTWTIMEYLTKNGEIQSCRNVLRANADFEGVVYDTLQEVKAEFQADKSIENARLFDQGFSLLKGTEVYSIQTAIKFLDIEQKAWINAIREGSNTFMNTAIGEAMVNKLLIYNTLCHGNAYRIGVKVIKVACPTDVEISDTDGNALVSITGEKITRNAINMEVFSFGGVKFIVVPANQEYGVHIAATDNGIMNYAVYEIDAQTHAMRNVAYDNIAIQAGDTYTGKVDDKMDTLPVNYDLVKNNTETITDRKVITDDTYIPVHTVTINQASASMHVGEKIQISAVLSPEDASVKGIAWHSSDSTVVSVSEKGEVSANKAGKATITAYSVDNGKTAQLKVIVSDQSKNILVSNITLTAADRTIDVGKNVQMTAVVQPKNASNKSLEWKSSDESVLKVDANGLVTAIGEGSARVTVLATDGSGKSASCEFEISRSIPDKPQNVPVKTIMVCPTNVTLKEGASVQLSTEIMPENATDKRVTWDSDHSAVASVDSAGLVTAHSEGTAKITVRCQDGSGIKAVCNLTVVKKSDTGGSMSGGNDNAGGSTGSGSSGGSSSNTSGSSNSGGSNSDNSGSEEPTTDSPATDDNSLVTDLKYYIVQFDANFGINLTRKTMTLLKGDALGVLPKVQRRNYKFKGWYTQKLGGRKVNNKTVLDASMTLYARWEKIAKPSKVTSLKLKQKTGGQLTIRFNRITNVSGYQIQYSTDKRFKSSVKKITTSGTAKTLKKLKKGRIYYVKVRAYRTDSMGKRIYGSYSKVKSIRVKRD